MNVLERSRLTIATWIRSVLGVPLKLDSYQPRDPVVVYDHDVRLLSTRARRKALAMSILGGTLVIGMAIGGVVTYWSMTAAAPETAMPTVVAQQVAGPLPQPVQTP